MYKIDNKDFEGECSCRCFKERWRKVQAIKDKQVAVAPESEGRKLYSK